MERLVFLSLYILIFTSCVSNKKYREATLLKEHYKEQAEKLEAIRKDRDDLSDRLYASREKEGKYKDQLAQISADLVEKTTRLEETAKALEECRDRLAAEKEDHKIKQQAMQEQLDNTWQAYQLQIKESNRLFYLAGLKRGIIDSMLFTFSETERTLQDYLAWKANTRREMEKIRGNLASSLAKRKNLDIQWEKDSTSLRLFIPADQLFEASYEVLSRKGERLLQQVAGVIAEYQGLQVLVEGKTTPGVSENAWYEGFYMSGTSSRFLASKGIPVSQLTATAGILPYSVSDNSGEEIALQEIRRLEVRISPQLDRLLDLLH